MGLERSGGSAKTGGVGTGPTFTLPERASIARRHHLASGLLPRWPVAEEAEGVLGRPRTTRMGVLAMLLGWVVKLQNV